MNETSDACPYKDECKEKITYTQAHFFCKQNWIECFHFKARKYENIKQTPKEWFEVFDNEQKE